MIDRKHNFNAGPATLPVSVLEKAQKNLANHEHLGLSVLEMSHRSPEFEEILQKAKADLVALLDLPDTYDVLFLQGGASLQFAMVPMNLGPNGAYVTTGAWSEKALKEAKTIGPATEIWSDAKNQFRRVPRPDEKLEVPSGAPYLHYTSNNTIFGTQWKHTPRVSVPLVADMSSDFLSRPIDVPAHGLIYAGAQKNAGPAGVVIVVGRRDLLSSFAGKPDVPAILRYKTHAENDSLYNTANTFGIYVTGLVFEWLREQGGVQAIQKRNEQKARRIYDVIDRRPDLFRGHAEKDSRSHMNVTFTLPKPELEKRFLALAEEKGCVGLKGHRSVGGLRASIYNALPMEGVEVLASLMERFEA